MIGQTLGHYRILERLGAGGMGVVYRAHDTVLERMVALKVLGERLPADETARARLLREARMASALNHPNICTVYEVGEAEGQTYIAMEFVEGRPLSSMIPAEGLASDQVLHYGMQIAAALAHAHDRGVVHRDLKSSNAMVTPDGRIKVLDFGLAKRLAEEATHDAATRTQKDALTQTGTIVGTLAYMSPEALRGEPADARSDIWALGVMLYEMASGRQPFQGKSQFDLTAAILREPVPELPVGVSPGLRPIIQQCLAREAGQRYQRAGEVRAALEAIGSAPRGLPAVPVSRRRWLWGIGGVAALGAAAVFGTLRWRQPRTYPPIPSKVPEANEYLQRALMFLTTQLDLPRARQMLEKALELDPKFAHARAWYGFTHFLLITGGQSNDTTWLYKAEEELRRALLDDPNSARAHSALAAVHFWLGRKELTPQEAGKAIELDPNGRDGDMMLAAYYLSNGEYDQAQALFKKVLDAAPLFFPARMIFGSLRQMGDPRGSIREQHKVLEQDPKNMSALSFLAMAHMTAGDVGSSRQALEQARSQEPQNYGLRLLWALQLALEGKREEALREMDPEVLKYAELVLWASHAAEVYAVLGDKAKALDWLDRDVRAGDEQAEWFQRDPLLKNIQDEPRFRQILDSIRYRREQRAAARR